VGEEALGGARRASSLNRLDKRGELLVQCVNLFTELVELLTGSLVEKFHYVQVEDVGLAMETTKKACGVSPTNSRGQVPGHLVDLYENTCDGCESNRERQIVAQLLYE